MFKDGDGNPTIGFCLWCGADFYTLDEHDAHIANDSAACAVYQELKDRRCVPPVLQASFEDAGITPPGGTRNVE